MRTLTQRTGRSPRDVKLVSRETRRLVRMSGASRARRGSESLHPVAFTAITAARVR